MSFANVRKWFSTQPDNHKFTLHDVMGASNNDEASTCIRRMIDTGEVRQLGKVKSEYSKRSVNQYQKLPKSSMNGCPAEWKEVYPEYFKLPDFKVLNVTVHKIPMFD